MKHVSRLLAVVLLLALMLMLVPMLRLAAYATPQADDLEYCAKTHRVLEESGSLGTFLKTSAQVTADTYRGWQGTFSAIFLMTLQPGIFGISYYGVTVYLLIGSLLLGLLLFCRALSKHVLRCGPAVWLSLFAILGLICTGYPPYPDEAFYWFNGGIYYTFFFSLALMLFSLVIAFSHRTRGKKRNAFLIVPMLLLCPIIGGGNFATALQSTVLLLAAALFSRLVRKDRSPFLFLAFLLLAGSLLVSVLAPGNARHATPVGGIQGLVMAIAKAVVCAALYAIKWTTLPVLVLGLAVLALGWRVSAGMRFTFPLPWLMPVLSWLFLAIGYTPTCYAIDYVGPDRLLDIQFYLYMLLFYANLFYVAGWLKKRVLCDLDESRIHLSRRVPRVAAIACVLLFLAVSVPETQGCVASHAVRILRDGSAATYHAEMLERYARCEDPSVDNVVLEPLSVYVEPLFLTYDLAPYPDAALNSCAARYFGKSSIILIWED